MKKTLPELKPAQSTRPGYGVLTLQGWETSVLDAGASFEVCVQRNQDSRFLGESGEWTATQTWHQVDIADEVGEFVNLTFGPNIVDPLVANPQMTYLLQTRLGQELGRGVMRIRDGVLSSHAAGQTGDAVAHVSAKVSTPKPVEPQQPAEVEQPVLIDLLEPEPAKQSNTKLPIILGLLALLLLLVGGYFGWTWYQDKSPTVQTATTAPATSQPASVAPTPAPVVAETPPPVAEPPPPAAEPPPPVAPTPAPVVEAPAPIAQAPAPAPVVTPPPPAASPSGCTAENLAATKDDLKFIQSCLKTNPTTDQILAVVAAAKQVKRCDVAQRLYVFKSNSGDVKVALAYAREYDPASFVAGCVMAADKETALYWYEFVLSKDPANQEAKDRIQALRS
jgi:hypothetical protein